MRIKKRFATILFCAVLAASATLSGCGQNNGEKLINSAPSPTESTAVSDNSVKTESSVTLEQSDTDSTYNESNSTRIALDGTSVKITGSGAKADGGTITISSAGTYILRGKLTEGKIVIAANKKDEVKLVLDNADITSSGAPAIYSSKCGKTILLLNKGTTNVLTDGKDYVKSAENSEEENDSPNAAVFIQDDLTILGEGTLTVNANAHNGITSKDTLKITGGTINVNAENHGITGKDNLYVSGGTITVNANNGDGLRSTYSKDDDSEKGHVYIESADINIICSNDGIQAEENMIINSGTISIVTAGGADNNKTIKNSNDFMKNNTASNSSNEDKHFKGLKAGADITISSGKLTIDAYDDAIHSNSNITINGGSASIKSGDDAVHADGTLEINNGTINVQSSYEGLEAEVINITGGNIDINAADDGINCSGGNDQSGFGGMDGSMKFRNGFGFNQNITEQNSDGQGSMPEMPVGENPQGNMPEMPQGENPQGSMPEMPQGENPQGGMHGNVNNSAVLTISGGTIHVNAQGDGLDSNGTLNITGGNIVIDGTTSGGNGIIDHDGSCTVSGGTLIGAGTSDMLEMPGEDSTQNTIAVLFEQNMTAGTPVYILDSSGKVIAKMSPVKNYGCFIFSSPDLKNGESYTVYTGTSTSDEADNDYYADGKVPGAEKYTSFTLSDSKVTYVNSSGVTTYSGGIGGGMTRNMFPGQNRMNHNVSMPANTLV